MSAKLYVDVMKMDFLFHVPLSKEMKLEQFQKNIYQLFWSHFNEKTATSFVKPHGSYQDLAVFTYQGDLIQSDDMLQEALKANLSFRTYVQLHKMPPLS